MLNIISNEIFKPQWVTTGQTKVFRNLLKALDSIGYKYVLNKRLDYCNNLWIYNDWSAVKHLNSIDLEKIRVVIGPDISPLQMMKHGAPEHINKCLVLQPSDWTRQLLLNLGYDMSPVSVWPIGIDTDGTLPIVGTKDRVLVYFKQRFEFELSLVENELKNKNICYDVVVYGNYNQDDYLKKLERAKYVIWIGRQESQGIAMGEALAMDVPMIVWEVSCFGHWVSASKKDYKMFSGEVLAMPAKSATYFNDECGMIVYDIIKLGQAVDVMESAYLSFSPRNYILNNLSLKNSGLDFIKFFNLNSNDVADVPKKGVWKNYKLWRTAAWLYYFSKKLV